MARMDLITEPRQAFMATLEAGAPTGSTNVTNVRFAAASVFTFRGQYTGWVTIPVIGTLAAQGTMFKIGLRGSYDVRFFIETVGGAGPLIVRGGLAKGTTVAALALAPAVTTPGIIALDTFSGVAATDGASIQVGGGVQISDVDAGATAAAGGTDLFNVMLSATGNTAPDAASVVEANALITVTRIADAMGARL